MCNDVEWSDDWADVGLERLMMPSCTKWRDDTAHAWLSVLGCLIVYVWPALVVIPRFPSFFFFCCFGTMGMSRLGLDDGPCSYKH